MLAHAARHARTARVTRVLVVMPQHEIEVMKKDAMIAQLLEDAEEQGT